MAAPEQSINNQQELQAKPENTETANKEKAIDTKESLNTFSDQLNTEMDKRADKIVSSGKLKIDAGIAQIGLSPEEAATLREGSGIDQSLLSIAAEAEQIKADYQKEIQPIMGEGVAATPIAETADKPLLEKTEAREPYQVMAEENAYLEKIRQGFINAEKPNLEAAENFEKKYKDERTGAAFFRNEVKEYAKSAGVEHAKDNGLEGKSFSSETKAAVNEIVSKQIDELFFNNSKEVGAESVETRGTHNKEKRDIMVAESARYIDLVLKAQAEGDISAEISADDILKLVEENVWTTAFQDRTASENTLGDHGVRHIVGYNIRICDDIYRQLEERGQGPKAIDILSAHQIMIMHDMGYATAPVRDGVDAGDFTADKGHNLHSSRILRERGDDQNDVFSKIFSKEQIDLMHEGVLKHDSSEIKFHTKENDENARRENLLSAVHLADNTHAFEDKLPEVLYAVPESLEIMLIMKAAGEIGDTATIDEAKARLVDVIRKNDQFSADDKISLEKAVLGKIDKNGKQQGGLNANSYKFTVGRICGNNPEVTITEAGKANIMVEENDIHAQVVGLFGLESYGQFNKFQSDLTGKSVKQLISEDGDSIDSANVSIGLKKKTEGSSIEQSEYQKQVETIITNESVKTFNDSDKPYSQTQKNIEKYLKLSADGQDVGDVLEVYREGKDGPILEIVNTKLAEIKVTRKGLLEDCKKGLGYGK